MKTNPLTGSKRGKGRCVADPKSVSVSDRVKAYPYPVVEDTPRPTTSMGECMQTDAACSFSKGQTSSLQDYIQRIKPLHYKITFKSVSCCNTIGLNKCVFMFYGHILEKYF